MKVARLPEAKADEILGSYRPVRASEPRSVPDDAARAIASRWGTDDEVHVVSAPKLLAIPGQRATIFIGETVRFGRTEAKVNAEGGLEFSIDEETPDDPATLGQEIVLTAEIGPDGRMLTLQLEGRWRELADELPPGSEAAMTRSQFEQHVREHRIETTFETRSGAWVLLGSPEPIPGDDGALLQVTLLRALVIAEDGGGR